MKANEYKLMDRCIEEGVQLGFHRARKHTEEPSQSQLMESIRNAIMLEICEWFEFDEIKQEAA